MLSSGNVNHCFLDISGKDNSKKEGKAKINIFAIMPPTLIVSATALEIQPLLANFKYQEKLSERLHLYAFEGKEIAVLITGVGLTATAFQIGKALGRHTFLRAINLGIAGSFRSDIAIGQVVQVVSDAFGDLGAQDGDSFLSLFDIGLLEKNEQPFLQGRLHSTLHGIPALGNLAKVNGISVNCVHGEENSIKRVVERLSADTESMEGAAFFYCCISEGMPCAQVRAVSNMVERRNRANWNIPLAVKNLNDTAFKLIREMA
jgi:futalosine hydrolase